VQGLLPFRQTLELPSSGLVSSERVGNPYIKLAGGRVVG
jgi:hypothetical protein